MFIRKTLFTVLVIIMLFNFVFSQSNRGMIRGKILIEDGNPISGVLVRATGSGMIGKTETTSDKNGVYRLFNLPQGIYKLKYEYEGFPTIIKDKVELKFGQTLNISVHMEIGSSSDVVNDKSKNPVIDVKSIVVGKTINKENFDKLPKGRDFSTIISIVPGVTDDQSNSGIAIGGASGAENRFYIDGIDVTSFSNGTQGQSAAFDFIESIKVQTGGFNAEYGGAPGGVISVITRSGGNEFHGEILGYFSGSALSGKYRDVLQIDSEAYTLSSKYYDTNELWGYTSSDSAYEMGFSLGGYLLKDKVWFFGSVLPRFSNNINDVDFFGGITYKFSNIDRTWMNYMIKLSAQIFNNVRFSVSYLNNFYKVREEGILFTPYTQITGGTVENRALDYKDEGFDLPNYSVSSSLDIIIGNNSSLSLRAGMFYTNQNNPQEPIPTMPLYMFFTGVPTTNTGFDDIPDAYKKPALYMSYGLNDSFASLRNIAEHKTASLDYNIYFNLAGEHSLKFGLQYVRQGEDVNIARQQPVVRLGWDKDLIINGENLGRGKYGYYSVTGNDITGPWGSVYKVNSNRISIYMQDSWTIGERLTMNFGVRAESEYVPSYSNDPDLKDKKQIEFNFGDKLAPRLGFVYDVKGDSSFKIFGSYGLYFDIIKLDMIARSIGFYQGSNMKTAYYTLDIYEFDTIGINNYYPGAYLGISDSGFPSSNYLYPDLKPVSEQVISFGAEKQLTDDILVGIRLTNKHLRYGIKDIIDLTPSGLRIFTVNPGYGLSIFNYPDHLDDQYPRTPRSKREYWELNLSIDKKFSNNWMGGFSYTWSRLTGNYPGYEYSLSAYYFNYAGLSTAWLRNIWYSEFDKELNTIDGPLPADRTHVIKAYGSYIFPFGLTLGTVINIKSGTPVTEEWFLNDIIYPYNRGNLGRTPMYYNADLYAEYSLKLGKTILQISVNISNLFNFKIAKNIWESKHFGSLYIGEWQVLSGNWDYPDTARPDPRYLMKYNYNDPISARLGVKLLF